jgi:hypothetical protein
LDGALALAISEFTPFGKIRVPELIEDASIELAGSVRMLIDRLMEHLKELDRQVDELDAKSKSGTAQVMPVASWSRSPASGPSR